MRFYLPPLRVRQAKPIHEKASLHTKFKMEPGSIGSALWASACFAGSAVAVNDGLTKIAVGSVLTAIFVVVHLSWHPVIIMGSRTLTEYHPVK
jgi:hypothetical protein